MSSFIRAATPKFLQKIVPKELLGSMDEGVTTPPPVAPAPIQQATPQSIGVPPSGSTVEQQNKKAASAGGFRSNLFTGGLGLSGAGGAIRKKKLGAG